jgi:hypothetical protein
MDALEQELQSAFDNQTKKAPIIRRYIEPLAAHVKQNPGITEDDMRKYVPVFSDNFPFLTEKIMNGPDKLTAVGFLINHLERLESGQEQTDAQVAGTLSKLKERLPGEFGK